MSWEFLRTNFFLVLPGFILRVLLIPRWANCGQSHINLILKPCTYLHGICVILPMCYTGFRNDIWQNLVCCDISHLHTSNSAHPKTNEKKGKDCQTEKDQRAKLQKGGCSCAQGPAAGQSGFNSQPFHKSSAKVQITQIYLFFFFFWCSLYCIWEHMWCSPLFPSTGNAGALSAMLTGQFDRSSWDEYAAPDDKCTSSLITSSELFEGALSRAFGYNHFLWVP